MIESEIGNKGTEKTDIDFIKMKHDYEKLKQA